jgi:hypothetical protein
MKERTRLASVLMAAALLVGCMVNPAYLPDQYSSTRLTDGRVALALAPDKYAELGGKGSPGLESFVRNALAKEGACPEGYSAADPMPVRGYVSIVVSCKSTKARP